MILECSLTLDGHVQGTLDCQQGSDPVAFDGWLDLMRLLEMSAENASEVSREGVPDLNNERPASGSEKT